MSIYKGSTELANVYLGGAALANAYLGADTVYAAAAAFADSFPAQTFDSNDANWAGKTVRLRIPASEFLLSADSQVRLTIESTGNPTDFQSMYVGHGAATGDQYDFEAAPVQVTVGGNGAFVVPGGPSTVVTDPIAFAYNNAKPFLVSAYIGANPNDFLRWCAYTGAQLWYKTGADAATINASGYSAYSANRLFFVKRVEVD